jgi:uncharacterized membrane protein YwzB
MNCCHHQLDANALRRRRIGQFAKRGHAGSALLIVLILLSVMGTLVVSNTVALRRLNVELQLLEKKQNRALQARHRGPELQEHR